MSEYSRRYRYLDLRVLISVNDVLGDPRPDMLVHLTGIQASLLRNMCQYLQRQSTFVSQYLDSLYVSPTQEEWDQIEAIVADMEDKLMGNGADVNLHGFDGAAWRKLSQLWGYSDRWAENLAVTADDSGYVLKMSTAVPAGYVYVVESVGMKLVERATTFPSLAISDSVFSAVLNAAATLAANTWIFWMGAVTLKVGDYVELYLSGSQNGDTFTAYAWGHKMRVDL